MTSQLRIFEEGILGAEYGAIVIEFFPPSFLGRVFFHLLVITDRSQSAFFATCFNLSSNLRENDSRWKYRKIIEPLSLPSAALRAGFSE